jgi:hypothetical protein
MIAKAHKRGFPLLLGTCSTSGTDGGAYAVGPAAARLAAERIAQEDGVAVGLDCGSTLATLEVAPGNGRIANDGTIVVLNSACSFKSDQPSSSLRSSPGSECRYEDGKRPRLL